MENKKLTSQEKTDLMFKNAGYKADKDKPKTAGKKVENVAAGFEKAAKRMNSAGRFLIGVVTLPLLGLFIFGFWGLILGFVIGLFVASGGKK